MKFASIGDLRTKTAALRKELKKEREIVLTANGRPFAVMVPVEPDTLEEELRAIRGARFHVTLDRIHAQSKAAGMDKMSMAEIDALIAEIRREKRVAQ